MIWRTINKRAGLYFFSFWVGEAECVVGGGGFLCPNQNPSSLSGARSGSNPILFPRRSRAAEPHDVPVLFGHRTVQEGNRRCDHRWRMPWLASRGRWVGWCRLLQLELNVLDHRWNLTGYLSSSNTNGETNKRFCSFFSTEENNIAEVDIW